MATLPEAATLTGVDNTLRSATISLRFLRQASRNHSDQDLED
jgi:hypothetical protein